MSKILSFKDIINKEVKQNTKMSYLKIPMSLWLNPSRNAVLTFRIAQYFYGKGNVRIAKILSAKLIKNYGLHISVKAQIGLGLELRHVNGVVIGEGVIIGENAVIYQQVTLGGQNLGDNKKGNYPIVGDNVTFFAGSKVIGAVQIGSNSIIGANSVVIGNVEENCVYAGVPAKKIK